MKDKILITVFYLYLKLVEKTSKITKTGRAELLEPEVASKYNIYFWHRYSYLMYLFHSGKFGYILTTVNDRGNVVAGLAKKFGYDALRLPDEAEGGNHLLTVRRQINKTKPGPMSLAVDGPLGPIYTPSKFIVATTVITKRQALPINVKVKHYITLKRWDKFMLPLPFNKIEYHISDPVTIEKSDIDETFAQKAQVIKDSLNYYDIY